jgi:hypothetical protein
VTEREKEKNGAARGYGNIYTPHAGSMIIEVLREGGLASRTIILSPRQVRLLSLLMSRKGLLIAAVAILSWVFFAVQAARVPLLSSRIVKMQGEAARLDTLEFALTQLQKRYEQVLHMLGASGGAATPAGAVTGEAAAPAPVRTAERRAVAKPAVKAAPPAVDTTTRPDSVRPDSVTPPR